MASSHVYVVDSSFKRTQIKVSPGKYMREVLEEACKSRKLNPESYTLKTQNNKVVDLSQPFRLSGLSAGAKLQLTQGSRSPSVISVALQLPESEGGTRLADKFPSTTSLWLILRKFEDAVAGQPPRKLNLTQRAVPLNIGSGSGRLEYEQPCLHLVSRNMETFADLQKTLGQLGLTGGNVLIRLSFKSSGEPLEEAMQKMEQYFSSVPSGTGSSTQAGAHAAPVSQLQSQPDASAPNAAVPQDGAAGPEPAEVDDTSTADVNKLPSPGDAPDVIAESSKTDPHPEQATSTINGMTVFRPPSSNTPAAALQQDDPSVFEPSVDQAKAHQASLLRSTRNQRLLSDKELEDQEAERTARLANVQTVVVRVRYPDQSQIETTINASETSAALYAKIMDTLACAPEPFELRYSGPRGHHEILPNSSARKLVRDFGFRGKVLVTLVWGPDASVKARQAGPVLKAEYLRHARDLKVDLAAQQAAGEGDHRAAMAGNDAATAGSSSSSAAAGGGSKGKGDLEAKMKKFLGFGKK